jgi:hypothetical protein
MKEEYESVQNGVRTCVYQLCSERLLQEDFYQHYQSLIQSLTKFPVLQNKLLQYFDYYFTRCTRKEKNRTIVHMKLFEQFVCNVLCFGCITLDEFKNQLISIYHSFANGEVFIHCLKLMTGIPITRLTIQKCGDEYVKFDNVDTAAIHYLSVQFSNEKIVMNVLPQRLYIMPTLQFEVESMYQKVTRGEAIELASITNESFLALVYRIAQSSKQNRVTTTWDSFTHSDTSHQVLSLFPCTLNQNSIETLLFNYIRTLNSKELIANTMWRSFNYFSDESIINHIIYHMSFDLCITMLHYVSDYSTFVIPVACRMIFLFCMTHIDEECVRILKKLFMKMKSEEFYCILATSAAELMKNICIDNSCSVYCVGDQGFRLVERYTVLVGLISESISFTRILSSIADLSTRLNWLTVFHSKGKCSFSEYLSSVLKSDTQQVLTVIRDRLSFEHQSNVQLYIVPQLRNVVKSNLYTKSTQMYAEKICREAFDRFPTVPFDLLADDNSDSTAFTQIPLLELYSKYGPDEVFIHKCIESKVDVMQQLHYIHGLIPKWTNNTNALGIVIQLFNYMRSAIPSKLPHIKTVFSESFEFQSPPADLLNILESVDTDTQLDLKIGQLLRGGNITDTNALSKLLMKHLFIQGTDSPLCDKSYQYLHSFMKVYRQYRSFFLADTLIVTYSQLLQKMSVVPLNNNDSDQLTYWRIFAPTNLLLAYSENYTDSPCARLCWDKLFTDELCLCIWPHNIAGTIVQYLIQNYSETKGTSMSSSIWRAHILLQRLEWLHDYTTNIEFKNWWCSVRENVLKQVESQQQQKKIQGNSWVREDYGFYYDSLYKPSFSRWVRWIIDGYTAIHSGKSIQCSFVTLQKAVYDIYIPRQFNNSYPRMLGALLVSIVKSCFYLKCSTVPSQLLDIISECIPVAEKRVKREKIEVKSEFNTGGETYQQQQSLSEPSESLWFLELLQEFPSASTQEWQNSLLTVIDSLKNIPLIPIPKLDNALEVSKYNIQICLQIKRLLEKEFLLDRRFIYILMKWAYSSNCELIPPAIYEVAKLKDRITIIEQTNQLLNPSMSHWLLQCLSKKNIKYVTNSPEIAQLPKLNDQSSISGSNTILTSMTYQLKNASKCNLKRIAIAQMSPVKPAKNRRLNNNTNNSINRSGSSTTKTDGPAPRDHGNSRNTILGQKSNTKQQR